MSAIIRASGLSKHYGSVRALDGLDLDEIEFWSGSRDRLHRRLLYQRVNDRWAPQRLQP